MQAEALSADELMRKWFMPISRLTRFLISTQPVWTQSMFLMGASVGLLVSVILHVPLLTWLLFTMEVANCFVNFSHRTCSITRTSLSSVRVTITLVLQ